MSFLLEKLKASLEFTESVKGTPKIRANMWNVRIPKIPSLKFQIFAPSLGLMFLSEQENNNLSVVEVYVTGFLANKLARWKIRNLETLSFRQHQGV